MSKFDDILDQPLPSKLFLEGADEEEKDDDKTSEDFDRQSVVDKIEKALKNIDDVDLDADDFISGDEDEIVLKDLEDDVASDVFDKLKDALSDVKEIEVDNDDDEVTISLKESAYDSYIDLNALYESAEDDDSDYSEDSDEDDYDEETDDSDYDEDGDEDSYSDEYDEIECDDEDPLDSELDSDFGDDDDEDDDIDDALDDLENQSEDDIEDGLTNADPHEDDEVEDLTPSQDQKADDMLAMVATPMLIKDELTAEESVQFYESTDSDIAVSEGLIMESDVDDIFTEGVFASPNKPFKMTKRARFKQLYELSVQIEARAHRDPQMVKLDRAYKIERQIKANLRKKYGNAAKKRAMIYLRRLMKSKSGVLKNLGKKIMPKR